MINNKKRLSVFSTLVLTCAFIVLAFVVPLSLRSNSLEIASLSAGGNYVPVETPAANDRFYNNRNSSSRPLFSRNRRPIAPTKNVDPMIAPIQAIEKTKLEAIVGGEDGYIAGLRGQSNTPVVWVVAGHEYESWKVSRVTAESVELLRGDDSKILKLYSTSEVYVGE